MTKYVVRKHKGHWTICSDGQVIIQFEHYDEALDIARTAARIVRTRRCASTKRERRTCVMEAPQTM